jgi:alanine racemase
LQAGGDPATDGVETGGDMNFPSTLQRQQRPADDMAAAGAVLTIDLGAVRDNYRRLKAMLGTTACAGVVKADGYGLGAAQVARALRKEGCTTFFVAHVGEGVALREALGPEPSIFILNGIPPGAEQACVAAALTPVANSAEQLSAWRGAARLAARPLKTALQVDSGMARLGMAPAEVEALAADPRAFDGVETVLVMSHLACADEPDHPANRAQLAEFQRLREKLPAAPAALANSSGVFLGPGWHFDLARPGCALYGINPTPGAENPMRPVVRLDARVIQTREIGAGAGVGYGHAYTADQARRTATISLGYADGWQRRNALAAFFAGARLPFIGRVSMDSIVLDVSALPPGRLEAGDLVELIGPSQTVDTVAANAGTIGYEVLTSLGHRFYRRYVGG